ncbi:MAG TPA: BTAD domain-containing putative transcriptional regulator [Gemmatimonadales bacterium]|jgi:serine/threonine-protein kinase
MLRLQTLGILDLRDASGRELRAVLQQPKRLGLLAYLAIAAANRLVRRDVLLGLFWPELDQDHARAALRRALYFLRKAMSEDVLEGRGDDEVGVRQEALWCDAVAFEDQLARGDRQAALDLYQGPLLEGFYIAGAPEAEQWLDLTRARLTQRAAQAAWSLAEDPATPEETAVEWARRARALTPDDEEAVRRQLLLHDRIGDRAGALRAYDDYLRRLKFDLDAEPSTALATLARTIRDRTPEPQPARPRAPMGLLAVLPFAVRGDPSLGYLAEGLVDLLSTAMDGLGGLRTVDPRALLAAVGPEAGEGDPAVGYELARQLGASHTLQGSVVAAGGKLRITATVRDLAREVVSRAEVQGEGEAALFELVDQLVRQLLVRREADPGERLSRLAGLTTACLPALRAWLEGEHHFRLGRYLPALEAYQRAASLDETFALAHYRVAAASAASAFIAPARQASAAAMRHCERLSERDRLLVEAQHAWLGGAAADAERRYAAVVATHPDDLEAWFRLGDLLLHSNPYRGRSIREARVPLERAVALDPRHVSALVKLARIAALDRRWEDLDALVSRVLALSPTNDQALGMRALCAFALRRDEDRRRVTEELKGARALTIGIAFTDLTLFAEDLPAVEELGHEVTGAVRSPELRALCHLILAHIAAAQGHLDVATDQLVMGERLDRAWGLEVRGLLLALPFLPWPVDRIEEIRATLTEWDAGQVPPNVSLPLAFHNGLHPHVRAYVIGLLAARLGDPQGVAAALEELAERPEPEGSEGLVERFERSLDAALHELKGDLQGALSGLAGARNEVWFQYAVASPFYAGGLERWRRAELLARLGRGEEAAGWFGSIAERSPWEIVFREPAARRAAELGSPAGSEVHGSDT